MQSRQEYKILENLINIYSPSNEERELCTFLTNIKLNNFIPDDKIINSVIFRLNLGRKKTVLLDAHIDEIHSRVVSITQNGFLVVKVIGSHPKNLMGRPVKIISTKKKKSEILDGVFLADIPHLKDIQEKYSDKFNEEVLYVDIGALNKEEAYDRIEIGDSIIPDYGYSYLTKDLFRGRGLDNKLGVFTLIKLLQFFDKNPDRSAYNIIINFSGKEEVSKAPYLHHRDTKIDTIIVVDTDCATDVPFVNEELYGLVELGRGPVITRSSEDSGLYNILKSIATKNQIPIQIHFPLVGGTNLSDLSKYNTLSQFIGIPIRNIHSPTEICNLNDIDNSVKLLQKFIEI